MLKHVTFAVLVFVINFSFGQDLTATQKIPDNVDAGSEFIVETNVNRGKTTGFLKFFQPFPKGFTMSDIDSKGGSFTFSENGAKIVWIASPAEAAYTTSYKVKVPSDASGKITVNGKIYFVSKNERKVFDLAPKIITIRNSGLTAKKDNKEKESNQTSGTGNNAESNSGTKKNNSSTEKASDIKASSESKKKGSSTSPSAGKGTGSKSNTSTASSSSSSSSFSSTTGKTYRVQVGAYTLKPKITGVPDHTTLFIDGMTKHFSGNFSNYDAALKHKNGMLTNGYKGSFIVTFENGKIISEHPKK